jgi:glycosyltransferase involved in cell wall biosynthesis
MSPLTHNQAAAPSSEAGPRAHETHPQAEARPLKMLWVKVGGLWPLNTGGRLRSFHLLRELSKNHDVSVLTTHGPEEDPDALVRQLSDCREVRSLPHTPAKKNSGRFYLDLARSWTSNLPVDLYKNRIRALRTAVTDCLESEDFDLIVADFLVAVPNVPLDGATPVLHFSHNVEYMIWKRLRDTEERLPHKTLLGLEWRKMRRYEIEACRRTDFTVAVSEQDRDQLSEELEQPRIGAIATGVDLDYFAPADRDQEAPREIVFSGSMDWFPNEDAMLHFMDEILPRIRDVVPDVTVTIVGRNPSEKLRAAAKQASVKVTGTVPDVRPYVHGAAVYIVPLRIGGGTRLKIYEALAMGKAVVSTHIGAEGLPLEEGKHIVRADEPGDFARAVLELLEDPARREALGDAGRTLMEERFSWAQVAREFEQYCRRAVREKQDG